MHIYVLFCRSVASRLSTSISCVYMYVTGQQRLIIYMHIFCHKLLFIFESLNLLSMHTYIHTYIHAVGTVRARTSVCATQGLWVTDSRAKTRTSASHTFPKAPTWCARKFAATALSPTTSNSRTLCPTGKRLEHHLRFAYPVTHT